MAAAILTVDSVTTLGPMHAGAVVVTGSHGGGIAAHYAARGRVRAAVFNDAGIGLEDAGVVGLGWLDRAGIAACAVSHVTARIGDAADTLASGIVSRANALAQADGVQAGMHCRDAAALMARSDRAPIEPIGIDIREARTLLQPGNGGRPAIVGLDSIGLVGGDDARAILVIGSHGALHGGHPASALPVDARAAFFHDAGRGRDDAGTSRLPVLAARGIPAATVDYRTARIGDARSMWARGILSCVNPALARHGVVPGISVQSAVNLLIESLRRNQT